MSILAPIGFYVCMGIFVLYGLWQDERREKKALRRRLERKTLSHQPRQPLTKAA